MSFKSFARAVWAPGALGVLLFTSCATPPRKLGVEVKNFDTQVRPQDDFYQYVNGTWVKSTPIPADRARYGTFIELLDKSEAALKAIIEEAAADKTAKEGSDTRKVGELYLSFMDTQRIESLGLEPIRPDLQRVAALQSTDELPELFSTFYLSGVQTPVNITIGQDAKQATRYIVYLTQSGLGLPDRDYYSKQDASFVEKRAAYVAYIEKLFTLAGQPDAATAAQNILALETRLAEKSWDRVRNRDREATYNLKTVAELEQLAPGFSWSSYLKTLGAEKTPAVIVRQPDYFQALSGVLKDTPLPVLKQYFTFKVLDRYADLLSKPFEELNFEFRGKTLQGQQENRPRWKRGVAAVEAALGESVGKLYVERHFSPDSKERMLKLVNNLRQAFQESIDQLEWMSPTTKARAQEKLSKFTVKIGYPEKWRDYSKLEIVAGDLVGNMKRATTFEARRNFDKLGKTIDRTEWGMTPQTVNAYYSSSMNEIVFPAAILQPPFFDPEADDATNYGAIGGVIGHEISHGFDDQGSRSDGDGNLRNWWTDEDKQAFDQRTGMLSEQYSAFRPIDAMTVNGKLTLGENIGDLSGLTVAYRAYKLSLKGKDAPVIDGYSGDQRFFFGWAQIWRSLFRDDYLRQMLLTDSHSPGPYRVNGVVRNMPEFHQAFGVKEGDGAWLPPEQRVKVW
ncbi:M13 family metallopeptidase [Hyalangium versicolor]|uniref:M13 family metallopeptidase n=1 Tax=Hyalangium versicolor TaxID=2861190 RepID=UPI001CCAC3B6|nr:M13-type metalloendopeptidase [Hyalangium versicolor]